MPKTGAERYKKWSSTESGKATLRARSKRSRDRTKAAAIAAYGGKCACCGETVLAFLTLDHVNSDGARHRRSMGVAYRASGTVLYQLLKQRGWPNDPPLQVLCFNCNCGRAANGGVCPHKMLDCLSPAEELERAKKRGALREEPDDEDVG